MPRKRTTAELQRLVVQRYVSGESSRAISATLDVSQASVLRIVKRHGFTTRRPGGPRIECDYSQAIALYESGLSAARVGVLLGASAAAVRKWLLEHGIQLRARSFYRRERAAHWKGGRTKHEAGYVLIYRPEHPRAMPNGYVREHILVMESVLGGPIPDGMDVHHRNGIKHDNRAENLEMLPKGEHTREHLPDLINARWPNRGAA